MSPTVLLICEHHHPLFTKCNQMLWDIGIDPGSNPASDPVYLTNQIFQYAHASLLVEFMQARGQVRAIFF